MSRTCTWSDICCTNLPEGYVVPDGSEFWISCHLDLPGPATAPDNHCPDNYGFHAHAFWHSACYSNTLNIFGNYTHTWKEEDFVNFKQMFFQLKFLSNAVRSMWKAENDLLSNC